MVYLLDLWDIILFLLDNLSSILKNKKLEVEIYKSLCKIEGERSIQEMQNINSSDIFDYLNEQCISRTNKNLTDIILATLEKINGINSYNYFLAEYTTLAFCGYSRDKNRNILNIMTDALHTYYAMRCDVLVTKDDGMRKKAQTEFIRFNSPTKIITIEELRSFLETELHNQYNLDYIQNEVIPKYSKGEDRGEVRTYPLSVVRVYFISPVNVAVYCPLTRTERESLLTPSAKPQAPKVEKLSSL